MNETGSIPARRRFAVDPRLIIGMALVAASVAGVFFVVSSADESVQVYAARDTLTPGDRVGPDDLVTRSVRLEEVGGLYLLPGDLPSGGFVVTRAVVEGELVPASAVGSVDGLLFTSVVLDVAGELAASIGSGSTVDVWAAQEVSNAVYGPPVVIVADAGVVRLVESDSIVGGGRTTAVEVLVPKAKVARVLEAIANQDAVSIVPATIPVGS